MEPGGESTQRRRLPWHAPRPLGYGPASSSALFVASPLLTAAALSLAGVVGGADDEFRWPGPILLLLVISALALVASIQLGYQGRLYLYSYDDLVSWKSIEFVDAEQMSLFKRQQEDQKKWRKYNTAAVHCFNGEPSCWDLGSPRRSYRPSAVCSRSGAGQPLRSSSSRPSWTVSGSAISI